MPSLKRDRLLSDLERERLEKRSSLDRHTRATNDVRVKKKLSAWLKDTDDVLHIIEHLPEDQLNQVFDDEHAYRLLNLAEIIMTIRNIYSVTGEFEHPEDWKTVIPRRSHDEGITTRPATDIDIRRAWTLGHLFNSLQTHYDLSSSKNPIPYAEYYSLLLKHPTLKEKVGPAEMKGLQKILAALEATHEMKE